MKEVVVSVLWGREDWFDHVSPSQWKHMNLSLGKGEKGNDVLLFHTPTNKFRLEVNEIISITDYDLGGLRCFIIKLSFDRNFAFRFKADQRKDVVGFVFDPLSLQIIQKDNLKEVKEANNLHFVNDFTSESIKDLGQLVSTTTSVLMVDPSSSSLQRTFISFNEEVTICQISTSNTHAIGITTDGRAFVWGEQKKHNPILGVGEADRLVLPSPVLLETPFDDDERVVLGVCGTNSSALISTKGRTSMWGRVVIQKKKDTNLITSNFLSPSLTYSIEEEEEEEEEKVEATFETYLKPEIYDALTNKRVSSLVLFGDSYFAIVRVPGVDDLTEVFSWGWAATGLLGHGSHGSVLKKGEDPLIGTPLEIEALKNETIIDLSVSHSHVMAVNQQGNVFVWGKNSRHSPKGQVGGLLGPTGQENEDIIWHPTKLLTTFGEGKEERALKVAAGQNTSLVLTQTRFIYTWGYSGTQLRLGLPKDLLIENGDMLYQTQPTKVPTIRDIDSVQTNGVTFCMVTKSQKGGIFMIPTEDNKSLWTYIPPLDSSCVFDSNSLEHQIVTVQASCYAWVASGDQKRVISSLWHPRVSHLIAFVARTFNKDPSSFSLLDALGEEVHPEERTSDCIQRMIFENITPTFIVTDLETLVESLKGKSQVWLDRGIQWASKEAILTLLYKYPQTAVCSPLGLLSQDATPFVRVGFHDVFFLTYKHLLKLNSKEVFDFLMKSYSRLAKHLDDYKHKKEKWLPSSLSRSQTASIITKLPKTRMLRILSAIQKWLEIAPTELFGDKDIIRNLMNFLSSECENPIPELKKSAIELRGIVCMTISRLPRHISYGQPSPEGLAPGSVLLNYHPKYIAEHLLWIDACHLHRTVTVTDICHLRVPKLQPRHTNVANWLEKELLQCPSSSLRLMIDNVVELGYYLLNLRDFFSFSALSGAMYQRPVISLTEDVWGKGTKLSGEVYGHWKEMQEARERVSKPAKYQRYFEESASPKVTFLGYSFNKLEMLNQKYKQLIHNNPPPESESPLFLFEWARVQAELAFFWKKTLDDAREQISESFTPDPNLIQFLLDIKGFRLNGSEHRKIANSYRVQKTSFLPEEETEKVEEATFETSPIQEADVEVVLLESRAEFITLSDNLRREAWEEWSSRLKNELELKKEEAENLAQEERKEYHPQKKKHKRSFHRRETAVSLQNIGETELNVAQEWYRLEEELLPFREVIVKKVWGEGSFGDLFLSSEALEVSLRDLVKSRPKDQTLRQFQDILASLFPYPDMPELILSAIFEIADYEEVCVKENVLKGKYKEVATEAIYHFVKVLKHYHMIFFNFEEIQEKFSSFLTLLRQVEHLSSQKDSKDALVENVIWSVFAFVDHAMNGSDEPLTPINDLIDPLASLSKVEKLAAEIGKLKTKKDVADYEGVLTAAKLLEETLKEQMESITSTIESKKKGGLSHSSGLSFGGVDFEGFRENLNNRALIYQRALRKKERSPVGASPLESLVDIMQQDIIPMIEVVMELVQQINATAVSALKSIKELATQTTQASYQRFTINKPRMDHEKEAFGVVLTRMMRLGLEIEDKGIFEQNEELAAPDTAPAFSLLTHSHTFSLPPPPKPFSDPYFKEETDPKVWSCLPQKVNTRYRINKSVLTPTHLWFCCKNGSIGCVPLSFVDHIDDSSLPPTPTLSAENVLQNAEKSDKGKEKKKKGKKKKEKEKDKEKEKEEEGEGERLEEVGEEGVLFASSYWFVDERSNIRCIEYCPETNKIWTADLKGTIQVWAASPVAGAAAAKQDSFVSEVEFRPHHSFFSHWSKETLELKNGALRWGGKHTVLLRGGPGGVEKVGVEVEAGIWKKFYVKMRNGDNYYFRSPTPQTILTWVQKILKCLDLAKRPQTLLEVARIESTEKSMDRIMTLMTTGGKVWGVDSMWKVVEFCQEKNNSITIKHVYNLQSIMKDIMVPEVGKSIILQNNFFITIGDSLIPLPVSNSPPPPFPPPLLRVEKTPNVLISVIFVQKYGDDCEIWCADLAGNLSIWDPKKKECLFEFLWAKNEGSSGEFVVKNQSDKKCFWNWGWDHDFVSTMAYHHQEVYIGTSRGAIFRISTTSRQIVPNSINQNAHTDEISSINHFHRGGSTFMITGCFDCSFSLWELSKKKHMSFIKK